MNAHILGQDILWHYTPSLTFIYSIPPQKKYISFSTAPSIFFTVQNKWSWNMRKNISASILKKVAFQDQESAINCYFQ